jgi:hypothetical protein
LGPEDSEKIGLFDRVRQEKFKPDPRGTRAKDTYMLTIFYESGDKVVFSSSWAAPGIGDRPWTPYGRLIRPVSHLA